MNEASARRPLIVLIDANSLFYRAFFAVPISMATSSGQLTNATYGFTAMLIKLLADVGMPAAIAACFDKGRSFRYEIYDQYKAQREAPPAELVVQKPLVHQVLDSLSIPIVAEEGIEGDDLLATLSLQAEEAGWDCLLVTGDKDAFQLISDHTKVLTTRKGITDTVVYDRGALNERYGIRPEQVVDMMSLRGDTSDNIPGVPGIGEKTAVKLILEYGDLDSILAAAESMKQSKLKENLIDFREQALLSRELASMRRDVPLGVTISDLAWPGWDDEKAAETFHSLEFRTLLERLRSIASTVERDVDAVVDQAAEVQEATSSIPLLDIELSDLPCVLASLDCASLGVDLTLAPDGRPQQTTFSDGIRAWRLSEGDSLFGDPDGLRILLQGWSGRIAVMDAKSLMTTASALGMLSAPGEDEGFIDRVDDVGLMSYVLDPTVQDPTALLLDRRYPGPDQVSAPTGTPEGVAAALLPSLSARMLSELENVGLSHFYHQIERPLTLVLRRMEQRGMAVDRGYLEGLDKELSAHIDDLRAAIYADAGEEFNINSPKQLAVILFDNLGLAHRRRTKTGRSTDAAVLASLTLDHPIIDKILSYRELVKIKGTYVDGLLPVIDSKTGRIHTTFNQRVAATGRLSSSDPNLQNIPVRTEIGRRIRRAFVAGDGYDLLVSADYSQVELRILAHLSEDPGLIAAFESGEDVHTRTASQVFGVPVEEVTGEQRRGAKAVNFGIVYGISAHGLSEQLKITMPEAQRYIDLYFERFPGVKRYIDLSVANAHRDGVVRTLLGRVRRIPELESGNFNLRTFGERSAVNSPIQGAAADFIKLAMIRLEEMLSASGLKSRMILQVHDELMVETVTAEKEAVVHMLIEAMVGVFELRPPLVVDVSSGHDWLSAKG